MDNYLTIGKAAGLFNLNPRTLRFYEQIGLLRPSCRSESGYRLYSVQDIEKLKFIIRAKEFGLTLEEIQSVLSLTEEGLCRSVKRRVGELLARKIGEIDSRIRELQVLQEEFTEFKSLLEEKSECPTKTGPSCSCLERN